MPELYSFEENNHFFIKFFVLDATLNLNKWGVTEEAMKANLDTFIGKPFVVTPDADHPDGTPDTLLHNQEAYRAGTIIEVGYDTKTGKAFGIAEITDADAIERIKSGEISFVSPSIIYERAQTRYLMDGSKVIQAFEGAHVAGVKDPAFGMYKAQIKGKCSGEKATCERELALVQASKEDKIKTFSVDGKTFMIQAQSDECVERWIKELSDAHPEWERDQIIAVSFEKCRRGDGILKKGVPPYDASDMVDDSNIDQESLENITQVNMPGKDNKRCGSKPDMPCTEENASLKQKNASNKSMTKAQNEEEKKKEHQGNIEEEEKKKMDAMDEDEKKKEESMDEEEEKKDEAQDDEDEKKKENQEARLRELEIKLANKDKEPLVHQIVEAKVQLGYMKELGSEKASKDLYDLPLGMLKSMAADYARMAEASKSPKFPYEMVQASREGNSMDADKLLARLKR